jgi:hypothetical protein
MGNGLEFQIQGIDTVMSQSDEQNITVQFLIVINYYFTCEV